MEVHFYPREWSDSSPGCLLLGEKSGAHWTGGWVDPSVGWDVLVKKYITAPAGNRSHAVQLVADYV
jgi:hypothetical protein